MKDRPAARMIADGERSGALTRDKILLDATSGNTGIAYAMIGAARGYRVRLCVPENVTPERKRILKAFGAEMVFTDPMEGSDGAILKAQGDVRGEPGPVLLPGPVQQPGQLARALRHHRRRRSSSRRGGRLTHFVAGLGTSGTFIGAGRRLREFKPAIRLISVQPDSPLHGLEGLKHMATAIVPGIYDPALADEDLGVGTEEAFELTRGGWRRKGCSSGSRAAPTWPAPCAWRGGRQDAVVVVIFCDGGEKYLSERFWDETGDGASAGGRADGARRCKPAWPTRSARTARKPIPNECCGALFGTRRRGHGHVRAAEHHRGRPAAAVPGAAGGLPRGREARARRSAPICSASIIRTRTIPARPSQYDLDHAWPFFSYIIVSVRSGVPEDMTSWRLRDDRSAFDQENLTHA